MLERVLRQRGSTQLEAPHALHAAVRDARWVTAAASEPGRQGGLRNTLSRRSGKSSNAEQEGGAAQGRYRRASGHAGQWHRWAAQLWCSEERRAVAPVGGPVVVQRGAQGKLFQLRCAPEVPKPQWHPPGVGHEEVAQQRAVLCHQGAHLRAKQESGNWARAVKEHGRQAGCSGLASTRDALPSWSGAPQQRANRQPRSRQPSRLARPRQHPPRWELPLLPVAAAPGPGARAPSRGRQARLVGTGQSATAL